MSQPDQRRARDPTPAQSTGGPAAGALGGRSGAVGGTVSPRPSDAAKPADVVRPRAAPGLSPPVDAKRKRRPDEREPSSGAQAGARGLCARASEQSEPRASPQPPAPAGAQRETTERGGG